MSLQEKEKLIKAKETVLKMANGINPLTDEPIEKSNFLHDPRMVRFLYVVLEVMNEAIAGALNATGKRPEVFMITDDEKNMVQLPPGKIGINQFAKCINQVIDARQSKNLTGVEINRKLKKMGILGEEKTDNGKTRTVLNAQSAEYGIEMERKNYNGSEFDMILFNEAGKKFLLENLEKIMAYKG